MQQMWRLSEAVPQSWETRARRDDQMHRLTPSTTRFICRLPNASMNSAIFWNGWPMPSRRTNRQSARKSTATGGASVIHAVGTLNYMLSQVLKPGTTPEQRQQILELIDNYSRYDPTEVAQFYDQLFDLFVLSGTALHIRRLSKPPAAPLEIEFETAQLGLSEEQRAAIWKLGWAKRGKVLDKSSARAIYMTYLEPLMTLSIMLRSAINRLI